MARLPRNVRMVHGHAVVHCPEHPRTQRGPAFVMNVAGVGTLNLGVLDAAEVDDVARDALDAHVREFREHDAIDARAEAAFAA